MNVFVRSVALSLVLGAFAASTRAGVLTDSVGTVGNQPYNGALGLAFDVASTPLLVTRLGAFDGGLNGFAGGTTITVGVFDRRTQALVGSSLTFTNAAPGTLVGAWREKAVPTPFALAAGGAYMIVAQGFNANDRNLNTGEIPYARQSAAVNSMPSLLSFTGGSYFDATNSGFTYAATMDGSPAIRYGAGNFSVQAVPEPASLVPFFLGALAFRKRRRRA